MNTAPCHGLYHHPAWVVYEPGWGLWPPPRLGRQEDYRFHHEGGTEHGRIDSGWFWSTPSHQSCVLNYANMGRKHWCISQFLGFAPPCLVVKVHLPCDKGHGWMPSMWVLGPADGFSSRVFHPSTGDDLGWFYANWDDLKLPAIIESEKSPI